MADEAEPPRQEPSGSKVHRTRTAEIIDAGTSAATAVARFTPQQAIIVICVVLMGFVCINQAFTTWSDREERRQTARERQDASALAIRENNAQAELTRQHCAAESTSLRAYFAEQNERRMRFEAEERAKDRAVLSGLTDEKKRERDMIAMLLTSFEELRKIIASKMP